MKTKQYLLKTGKIAVLFCVIVLGALFVVLGSPLNPFSNQLPDIDSSIFLYFGYGIRGGKLPYVDMKDHKGPLLWTIEYLGVMLGNGSTLGVWILELAVISLSMFLLYLIARLFVKKKWAALVCAYISMEPVLFFYQEGNFSEVWSLPFMLLAMYFFLDFLRNEKCTRMRIILIGMCCGAVLCIRANMVAVWISFILAVMLRLVIGKRWKELWQYSLCFLIGVALPIIPYVIYYGAHHALYDMWDGYINYNFFYIGETGDAQSIKEVVLYFLKQNVLLWIPVAVYAVVLLVKRQFNWLWSVIILWLVSLYLNGISGRTFPHYGIPLIVCVIVPIAYLTESLMELKWKKIALVVWGVVVLGVLCYSYGDIQQHALNIRALSANEPGNDSVNSFIEENSEKLDPILVMSLNAYYYVGSGRLANTPDFIQHFMYDSDRSLYTSVLHGIDENPPKVIIMRRYNVDGDPWGEWMTDFYDQMQIRVAEGSYRVYETDFFVGFVYNR